MMSETIATDGVTVERRKRVNLYLSRSTHGKIKIHCAKKGVTMQAELERLLDRAFEPIEDPEPAP